MKIIRAATPQEFEEAFAKNSQGRLYVLLFGNKDSETNESWCPDCVIADPLVRKALFALPEATLIECAVGDRIAYKDPGNYYRNHKTLAVKSIPSLYLFEDEKLVRMISDPNITEENLKLFTK